MDKPVAINVGITSSEYVPFSFELSMPVVRVLAADMMARDSARNFAQMIHAASANPDALQGVTKKQIVWASKALADSSSDSFSFEDFSYLVAAASKSKRLLAAISSAEFGTALEKSEQYWGAYILVPNWGSSIARLATAVSDVPALCAELTPGLLVAAMNGTARHVANDARNLRSFKGVDPNHRFYSTVSDNIGVAKRLLDFAIKHPETAAAFEPKDIANLATAVMSYDDCAAQAHRNHGFAHRELHKFEGLTDLARQIAAAPAEVNGVQVAEPWQQAMRESVAQYLVKYSKRGYHGEAPISGALGDPIGAYPYLMREEDLRKFVYSAQTADGTDVKSGQAFIEKDMWQSAIQYLQGSTPEAKGAPHLYPILSGLLEEAMHKTAEKEWSLYDFSFVDRVKGPMKDTVVAKAQDVAAHITGDLFRRSEYAELMTVARNACSPLLHVAMKNGVSREGGCIVQEDAASSNILDAQMLVDNNLRGSLPLAIVFRRAADGVTAHEMVACAGPHRDQNTLPPDPLTRNDVQQVPFMSLKDLEANTQFSAPLLPAVRVLLERTSSGFYTAAEWAQDRALMALGKLQTADNV